VPIAITAFSQEAIQEKSITAVQNLQNDTPSLLIGGQSRDDAQFTLRGLGAGPISTGVRTIQSVATYFDQVPSDIAGPGIFYDLENVQILKGPQGTLFGRNTVGGAILFEPKNPAVTLKVIFRRSSVTITTRSSRVRSTSPSMTNCLFGSPEPSRGATAIRSICSTARISTTGIMRAGVFPLLGARQTISRTNWSIVAFIRMRTVPRTSSTR